MNNPFSAIVLAFGIPGIKPLVIVAVVAIVLYGRTGRQLLGMTRYGRVLRPFLDLVPPLSTPRPVVNPARTEAAPKPRTPGYVFWALVMLAAIALVGSMATRYAVYSSAGSAH